jgi:L-asparaginase II
MLTLCRLLGTPTVGYFDFEHPAQAVIKQLIVEVTGLPAEKMAVGIDGCSVPNYHLPIKSLARAFARLAVCTGPDSASSEAMATIVEAMRAEPAMVSGIGRFDLALAEAAGDRLVCKAGGEAIECVALTDRGWGLTVKVADGGLRALSVATTEILRQLGVLSAGEIDKLHPFAKPQLKNHRQIITGHVRPAVNLKSG